MNILEIINLAGLFFLLGWLISRRIDEIEIKELQEACSYYYHQWKKIKPSDNKD